MRRETPATMMTLLVAIGLTFVGIQPGFAADETAASGKLVLKEGSEVKLKFAENLSSKTATEGDPVNLILDEDIKIGTTLLCHRPNRSFISWIAMRRNGQATLCFPMANP